MLWKHVIKNDKPMFRLGATGRKKLSLEMEKDIEYVVNLMMKNPEKIAEFRERLEEILEEIKQVPTKPRTGNIEFVN
jgi:hypothetical protein|tara:strand:- start:2731 stop:2961 length:231 start_codon:yes stop_codon:yes gene_type:complete